jgi:YHS domain-containing protein
MRLIYWAIRVLVILLVVRYVVQLVNAWRRPVSGRSRRSSRPPERIGGTLVRDPQCGTYVPKSGAVALAHGATTEYFCSTACRDAWTLAHRH